MEFNKLKESSLRLVPKKKYHLAIVGILFLIVLFMGVSIRVQPIVMGNLIDATTGDYVPLALDPYYFLRVSETLVANDGVLPAVDNMRYQALNSTWSPEILPQSTVLLWKTIGIFNSSASLSFANVLNPVVFFGLGLILFFILAWVLVKNKWIAIIASLILSVIPPYLYRTLAGFSDHEAIGMFGFFLALLIFAAGMFYLERKKSSGVKAGLIGLASGFAAMLAIASWGGGAKFLFMILPAAFLIRWLTKKDKMMWNYVLFYGLFVFGTLLSASFFGFGVMSVLNRYLFSSVGILTFFTLGYCLIEAIILELDVFPKSLRGKSKLVAVLSVIVLGGFFYQIFVGNFFSMIYDLVLKILYPFGTGRVGLTVAENKQPYLTELVSQVGGLVFYTFLAGCFIVGGKLASGIKRRKFRYVFTAAFAFFVVGILFSKLSPTSILSGENFISKALFFLSFLILVISSVYIYRKSEWKIDMRWIFIAAWMIPMLLAVRSAIRVFFAIVPFISLMVPIALFEAAKLGKKGKDDIIRILSIAAVVVVSCMLIFSLLGYYESVNGQAQGQTPSYNSDWQKAMNWTRESTPEGSVFLHWWDYGYWVQTGGNRPTVTDGGHFNGHWDHLIGRYVLTTPYPETAKSFMLAHNVSYLLIDPTDIGKYSAYSSIGDDEEVSDRATFLPTLPLAPAQTQEKVNSTVNVYSGGYYLDQDITYEQDGRKVLLPKGKAALVGILLETLKDGTINQPIAVYQYNNQQYRFPVRYLANSEGTKADYRTGIEATVITIPSYNGQGFDDAGAVFYLSEKSMNSLVVKLYLMGDPDGEYSELELVHSQGPTPFNFYYNGFRGPIRIYKVNADEMNDIIPRDEFKSVSGTYGEFDDLEFVK